MRVRSFKNQPLAFALRSDCSMNRRRNLILLLLLTFSLCAASITIDGRQTGVQKNILYLHNPINPSYYQDWEAVLMGFEYNLEEMNLQEFLSNPQTASVYDLIVVGSSVSDSNGNGISQNEAQVIANAGKPVLASGYGGWIILRLADFPYGFVSSAIDNIEAYDGEINHTIYNTPYNISYTENDGYNNILISDSAFNDIFTLEETTSPDLTRLGWVMSHVALARYYGCENNPDMFFFGFNNASLLNSNGQNLVANIIEWLLGYSESKSETNLALELPLSAFPGDFVRIVATLTDRNENVIEGAPIHFYVNDTHVDQSSTNESGMAIAFWNATSNCTGNATVYAVYLGSQLYLSCTSINRTITVVKIPTVLSMEVPSLAYAGQNVTLVASLSFGKGYNMTSSEISFFINGTCVGSSYTDDSGVAMFMWEIPEGSTGVIESWAVYEGDRAHAGSISNSCIIDLVATTSDSVLLIVSLGASSSFVALGLTITVARRRIRSVFGR